MDSIWGEDGADIPENSMSDREWKKMHQAFTNHGYREGLAIGKENGEALQEGFDIGFAEHGVPLGTQVGELRGFLNAALGLLQRPTILTSQKLKSSNTISPSQNVTHNPSHHLDASPEQESTISRLKALINEVNKFKIGDLAPPDREAYEHAAVRARELAEEGTDDREKDPKVARREQGELDRTMEELVRRREMSLKRLEEIRGEVRGIVEGMGVVLVEA
jgi:hypothetical protein